METKGAMAHLPDEQGSQGCVCVRERERGHKKEREDVSMIKAEM